jgi:hypothetical protein
LGLAGAIDVKAINGHLFCSLPGRNRGPQHSLKQMRSSPVRFLERGPIVLIHRLRKNYDFVAGLAITASIALPQSLLNWKPMFAR